jgi:hypothetical protein
MKRFTIAVLAMIFTMSMPMTALAMKNMNHGDQGKTMAEEMKQQGDQGMKMDQKMASSGNEFAEVGKDSKNGVVATVKIKTYDDKTLASMKKMGMSATHHVMVFFTDEKSGDAITVGKAALKVKGQSGKPAMLMQMGAGFGGDVTLKEMMSTFEIGTKLEDGKKRQFSVMYHNM